MAPSDHTLLITGASGFIGGHLLSQAFAKGYKVRAVVRSQSAADKILAAFPSQSSQLSFAMVEGITDPEYFKDAFAGITGVLHLATPVHIQPEDNKRDLLDPAIQGTLSIVQAAHKYGNSVQRLVNTSNMGALMDTSKGLRPGYTYSEKDWNPMTYDEAAAAVDDGLGVYCASKSLAEKSLWAFAEKEKPSFSVVSVNPSVVYGPLFYMVAIPDGLNPSSKLVWDLVDAPAVPPPDYPGVVDVRNVAQALLLAFETPEAAGERFLLAQHFDWQLAVDGAREVLPEPERSRIPEGKPGSMGGGAWKKDMYAVDGSKAERVLGLKYLSVKDTIGDFLKQTLKV